MKITFGNLGKILRCGFRLKCPRCGEGALFQTFFTMFTHCRECNLKFERESGYFIGAMYLNYGATVLIAFPSYFLFEAFTAIPFLVNLGIWTLFPLSSLFFSIAIQRVCGLTSITFSHLNFSRWKDEKPII